MQNKPQQRQQNLAMIADWQQSSLSQKQYCLQHHNAYHVFYYWYNRSNMQSADKGNEPGAFVKLQTASPARGMHTELLMPDSRRLIFHQPVSADFLKALVV
jgi:hypothetical protein